MTHHPKFDGKNRKTGCEWPNGWMYLPIPPPRPFPKKPPISMDTPQVHLFLSTPLKIYLSKND
jgi:hypothetical protein